MTITKSTRQALTGMQTMNERQKETPRFTVIEGGRRKKDREEAARRAELQQFIRACEALYEKNRARREV